MWAVAFEDIDSATVGCQAADHCAVVAGDERVTFRGSGTQATQCCFWVDTQQVEVWAGWQDSDGDALLEFMSASQQAAELTKSTNPDRDCGSPEGLIVSDCLETVVGVGEGDEHCQCWRRTDSFHVVEVEDVTEAPEVGVCFAAQRLLLPFHADVWDVWVSVCQGCLNDHALRVGVLAWAKQVEWRGGAHRGSRGLRRWLGRRASLAALAASGCCCEWLVSFAVGCDVMALAVTYSARQGRQW